MGAIQGTFNLTGASDTHHFDDLWVYVICYHFPLGGDVLQHLVQSLSFDLFALELRIGIVEVEEDCALMQLLDEELWSLGWWGFWVYVLRCGIIGGGLQHLPMKDGNFSISTFSVMTNRLLRCFRGGFPTIGMVSFGPVLKRPSVLDLGGVLGPSPRDVRSMGSEEASELTTTIGGAGAARS